MRAAVITKYGGPEVLEIRDVPQPTPGPHEVLVRVHASALNRADLLQRQGRYPPPPGISAEIPGLEFAGEVEANGSGAARWKRSDRVFGIIGGGAHAEYLTVHQDAVAAIPPHLTWPQAGGVPEVFITAHDALVAQAGVKPGEHVLVHAVGSGVGLAAVQLARSWGAKPYGTARTADKLTRAKEYGLLQGIELRSSLEPLADAVKSWTDGHGIDVTLDLVGGEYFGASLNVAALKGRLMLVGTVAGRSANVQLGSILSKRLIIRGTVLRARSLDEKIAVTQAFAVDVVPRLADGKLRPVIDSVFALDQIGKAHERLESNQTFGKVILTI